MLKQARVIAKKIRTWGIKGILSYAQGYFFRNRQQNFFRANASKFPIPTPEFGITIVGCFTQYTSSSKTLRDLAKCLKKAAIPYQTYNVDAHPAIPVGELDDILTPPSDFRIKRFPFAVELHPLTIPRDIGLNLSRIVFWEFESGVKDAIPDIEQSESIIAMSRFNCTYFNKILNCRVRNVSYPFSSVKSEIGDQLRIRKHYGIDGADFMVFFNFDFGSSYYRKNPEGAVRAFARALGSKKDAKLVFKTMRTDRRPDLLQKLTRLSEELGVREKLIIISDYLSEKDVIALTATCNVYLSLHRGEGFGITLAEAMSLARPVICTNYSATTEFCRPDCTIPVPYQMIPVSSKQIDHPCYKTVKLWAEPDIDEAARALTKLYNSPELCKDIGNRAKLSIESQFSSAQFRESILSAFQYRHHSLI